jgi:hypothetical protein
MSDFNPVAAFNAAYVNAQAKCKNPPLDSVNPAFRSKFASLAATRNEVVPAFASCDIAIQQTPATPQMIGDRVWAGVRTVLRHKDGHVEDLGDCLMPVQKMDAQGIASCLTYAKRQSLQALAGVTGEVDDDANEATGKPGQAENVGQWDHSPKDGLGPTNTRQVNADAKRLIAAQDDQDKLWSIWAEIKDDHAHATAVWGAIPRSIKDRINDAKAVKEPRAA